MPRCPKCKTQAVPISYEGVRIYHCGDCGGHWLAQARLDLILRRRELDMPEPVRQKMMDLADESHSVERLTCFTCAKTMEREQFKHWDDIQIDRCPQCAGIWLDRGELEKCQIYWEYLQDNPETWAETDIAARKALLELEWQKRRAAGQARAEFANRPRNSGLAPMSGIARIIASLFGR